MAAAARAQPALSLNDRQFIQAAVRKGVRIDGRSPMDVRQVALLPGARPGVMQAQYGRTRVLASVSADMVSPFPDRPAEGFLNFFVDLSPMASPSFEAGRFSEEAVALGRLLERSVRDSGALDTESLCVLAGERVWAVRCDVHVLDHDGNLADCACLATVAALSHFRRPDVTVVGDVVTVHSVDDRQPVGLVLHHVPVSVTFCFIADAALCVCDPLLREEQAADATLSVTVNAHKEVCCLQKAGGLPIPQEAVLRCASVAVHKATELTALLRQTLKQEEERANKRGRVAIRAPERPAPLQGADAGAEPRPVESVVVYEGAGQRAAAAAAVAVRPPHAPPPGAVQPLPPALPGIFAPAAAAPAGVGASAAAGGGGGGGDDDDDDEEDLLPLAPAKSSALSAAQREELARTLADLAPTKSAQPKPAPPKPSASSRAAK